MPPSQNADGERDLADVLELSRVLLASKTHSQVPSAVVELGSRVVSADGYAVWRKRMKDGVWTIAASAGLSDKFATQAAVGVTGESHLKGEPLAIEDIEREPIVAPRRDVFHAEGIQSMLVVPIRGQGECYGTVVFYWRARHRSSAAEIRTAATFASFAATALATAETVERSTAELDLVSDSVPALISYVDTQQRFRRVNHAYEEFFGRKREDIIGRTVAEVVGPEHYEVAGPHLERALQGEPQNFRSRVRSHDGALREIELSYTPDIAGAGVVRGVVVMVQDITERNRADEARARLAAIVDSSDDAIVSKTLDGIITSWNRAAERMFGYTSAEAVGRHITLIIPDERRAEEDYVLARLRRGEKIDHFETERQTKDGRIINISLTVSPVRDPRGNIIGASKIARDITDRKRAEAERLALLAREKQARETAELLNRVGPILSAELDPQKLTQKITDIATQAVRAEFGAFFYNLLNEAGESYVLYTLSGAPRETFEGFPMPRNTQVFGPTFRGEGIVRSDDITKDPRYGHNAPYYGMPKGHLPVCSYLAVPVMSRLGEAVGGLFFGHSQPDVFNEEAEDIVQGIAAQAAIALDNAALFKQSQESEEALRRSNEELRRANEDLNQFAHSASHDLQEPLRTVSVYSQLLRRKFQHALDEEGEEYIRYVVRGALRMEALVKDLLAYTQASTVSEEPAPSTDANTAIDAALLNLKAAIEDSGALVTYSALPHVRIFPVHLTQLFQNLIGNAIKYRRDERPTINIHAEARAGEWLFSVADNGIGIEEKYKQHIFGIFKRLHSADEYSGTGVGLAICQRIVERNGGRIWVESQPGRGSTFFFTLPAGD